MRYFRTLALVTAMWLAPVTAENSRIFLTKERMQLEIDVLKNIMEVRYAPLVWKAKYYAGWSLEGIAAEAKQRVATYPADQVPIKVFQRIVRDFFNSFKDYHVGAFFYSTEEATLPLRVKGAEGKYYIVAIDRDRLSAEMYPFAIGDELVAFNGRLTGECIEELCQKELRLASVMTDQALAEEILTSRSGMDAHIVPQGAVTITVRSAETQQLQSYQLCWTHNKEHLKWQESEAAIPTSTCDFATAFETIFGQPMLLPRYAGKDLSKAQASYDYYQMGGRYSYVPALGQIIWESTAGSAFHAYLFQADDGRAIGYLRLAHYNGGEEEVNEFGRLMDYFQEHAEALIIDQLNNPGGSPLYLYALASTLFDQPFQVPKHRVAVTHNEAAMAATMLPLFASVSCDEDAQVILGDNLRGVKVTYQLAQLFAHYLQFILNQWQAGHYITDSCAMYGIDCVNPHPQYRYTKPILLLVNSMDFSAADFFAAILQDNQRALLLGERTAGAGGTYFRASHLNPFGVRCYGVTTSLAERSANGQVLENLGVSPDIPYQLTAKDLQQGYDDYRHKILKSLQLLLPAQIKIQPSPSSFSEVD